MLVNKWVHYFKAFRVVFATTAWQKVVVVSGGQRRCGKCPFLPHCSSGHGPSSLVLHLHVRFLWAQWNFVWPTDLLLFLPHRATAGSGTDSCCDSHSQLPTREAAHYPSADEYKRLPLSPGREENPASGETCVSLEDTTLSGKNSTGRRDFTSIWIVKRGAQRWEHSMVTRRRKKWGKSEKEKRKR